MFNYTTVWFFLLRFTPEGGFQLSRGGGGGGCNFETLSLFME